MIYLKPSKNPVCDLPSNCDNFVMSKDKTQFSCEVCGAMLRLGVSRDPPVYKIQYQEVIKRKDLTRNPTILYIFGDNLEGWGYGGQAKEMRGEPNAVGIPTKVSPYIFFSDKDLLAFEKVAQIKFQMIKKHLDSGGVVIFPANGIGTGLAMLKDSAPLIEKSLKLMLKEISIDS